MLNLIIVSHPDDEILGYGGTGFLERKRGTTIQPVILCGEVEARNKRPENKEFLKDMINANSILGFNKPILGNFPNLKMNIIPHIEIVQFIEKIILDLSPNNIFTHHPNDLNDDHVQVSKACLAASRIYQRNNSINNLNGLYFMEVLSSTEWSYDNGRKGFNPQVFVDIHQALEMKIKALSCYRNVMRKSPHPRSEEVLKALSLYRGAQIGFQFAEAFEVCFSRGFYG